MYRKAMHISVDGIMVQHKI